MLYYGIGNALFLNTLLYINRSNLLRVISNRHLYGLISLTTLVPILYRFN